MLVRFRNDAVRRACSDLAMMRSRWGLVVARTISRRLQQLEAMTTPADLAFLPFDSHEHADGVFEVAVTRELSLLIELGPDMSAGGARMSTITVTELRDRSTARRTS